VTEMDSSTAGALSEDTPCGECGYNLRGLTVENLCPECGTPISKSMHRGLLRYSHPNYIWKLKRAVDWMLWGRYLLIAYYVLYWTIRISYILRRTIVFPVRLHSWILFVGTAITLIGSWKLSRPDGHISKLVGPSMDRRLLRYVLASAWAMLVVQVAAYGRLSSWAFVNWAHFQLAVPVLNILYAVLLFRFIATLCQSIPDGPMANWSRQILWVVIATDLVSLTGAFVYVFFDGWVGMKQNYAVISLYFPGARTLAMLVASGFYIPFLIALRRRFGEQLELSRRISFEWARAKDR
jgi:hypothetical protein